jgi:para-aminobenzoate synthetase
MDDKRRIAIIDNYDSFTYNLVQRVTEAVGFAPCVIRNDDVVFLKLIQNCTDLKQHFDLIILSPGPGNPMNDVGPVTNHILSYFFDGPRRSEYPALFGVCMGYEAIGVKLGIGLIKTVPRHGLLWEIMIDKAADCETLFRGLPDLFKQVRYHSLILDPKQIELSEHLVVTSRCWDHDPSESNKITESEGPSLPRDSTPDWLCRLSKTCMETLTAVNKSKRDKNKIPMSFRHRSLPVYGVQFHPESILSEFGEEIIKNICHLAGINRNMFKTAGGGIERPITCEESPKLIHTISDLSDLEWWTYELFRQIVHSEKRASVWLDSPVGSSGRWSLFAGGHLDGEDVYSVYKRENETWECVEGLNLNIGKYSLMDCEDFLKKITSWIDSEYDEYRGCCIPFSVPCIFQVIGYEGSDAYFIVTDRMIAVDNLTGHVYGFNIDDWEDQIRNISPETNKMSGGEEPGPPVLFRVADSKWSYEEKIHACKIAIEQGESYELCLTTQIDSTDDRVLSLDPLDVYRNLRNMNPAHYSCYFQVGQTSLLVASPERFLKVDGSTGIAQMKPIKGTRRRGRTFEEDTEIKEELRSNEKDLAENLMIVDLVRNDLSTVCADVTCPTLMSVETYAPYHQLVSTVEGRLPTRKKLIDVIFRLFPAGSMTGAPKIRSIHILRAIEGRPRGLGYSGTVGYTCPRSGDADLAVTIRSILFNKKAKKVSIGCGGAILALSDPEDEWREMILKAKRSLEVLSVSANSKGTLLEFSEKGESMFIRSPRDSRERTRFVTTMRYEQGRGIWLFERHINRLWNCLGGNIDNLRNLVLKSISAQASRLEPGCVSQFETFSPLLCGPFVGICDLEWTHVSLDIPIRACKIRVQVADSSPSNIECCLSPLILDQITSCRTLCLRVDSGDAALRIKTADWSVPGIAERDRTLLVNELGHVTETGIASIAVRQHGYWVTPDETSTALLPGTLRAMLVDRGLLQESIIRMKDLEDESGQIYCLNALRGVFAVRLD